MKKLLIILLSVMLFATMANAQVQRYALVGELTWAIDAGGASWVSGITSNGQIHPNLWQNWEPWPNYASDIGYHGADINSEGHTSGNGKPITGHFGWWVGATNWQAPATGQWGPDGAEAVYEAGKLYDIFVNDNGPVTLSSLVNTPKYSTPVLYNRVDMPAISVDGTTQLPVAFNPFGNDWTVDADLETDAKVVADWSDPIGIEFHNNLYAWSHPDYKRILIYEQTIKNSGECNFQLDGLEKEGQTFSDLWLGARNLIAPPYDWSEFGDDDLEYNGEVDWLLEYDPETRYFWTWDGDAADINGDDQFDPRGGPNFTAENPTGEFMAPEVCGMCFIVVESTPGGGDDPSQPATFRYQLYKNVKSPVNGDDMTQAWNLMTGADGNAMYMEGFSADPYQVLAEGQPNYDPMFGIGPLSMAANDEIKVVVAYAVGSISEARAIELGKAVKDGTMSLADAKKEVYETGRDDLFAKFELAKKLYLEQNLAAPQLPDPPTNIAMTSGPETATITWDAVSGAAKYRVYRAVGGIDNARVYDLQKETTETSFEDTGLVRGNSYFYNIVSVDANGLESNPFFTRINKEVIPFRAPETTGDWADKVRVVPNPINVKGYTYQESSPHNSTGFNYDGGIREQNTVLFVNLPEQCEINVYNSMGARIKTLNHTSGSGDERWSPIITDYNVFPASGVYFYTIEVTAGPLEGEIAKGKLVIIR